MRCLKKLIGFVVLMKKNDTTNQIFSWKKSMYPSTAEYYWNLLKYTIIYFYIGNFHMKPGSRSPGLNFGVFEYHTRSIQNKTHDDIGKFINVTRSFILNTPHKRGMTIQISLMPDRTHSKMCRDFWKKFQYAFLDVPSYILDEKNSRNFFSTFST